MKELSKIMRNLPQSGIRKLQDAAREVPDAIRLETGEPNFKTPDYICEAATQAMKDGFTKYTAVPGIKTLRDVLAEDFTKRLGIEITANQIVVTGGATMALEITLGCLGNPGDEILIPDPSWPVYEMQVLSHGLTPVPYVMPADNGFEPKRENIEPLITDKTKAIMVNTPSNPTGAVFSQETVQMIMDLAKKYDLYVLSDEVYDYLTFEGKHYSLKTLDDDGRVILISGASKKYAMTGWRVGYAIASEEIVSLMNQLMVPTIGNATAIAQKAVEAAVTGPQDFVEASFQDYKKRRDAAAAIFQEEHVGFYYPHGAFYMMVNIACCGMDSEEFALKLLAEEHVAVAPGGTFGQSAKQMIRISCGTEMEELCEGIRRMCRFIKKYTK
ncbi:MAG: aminotransferase class I/II-fold pyridoxal phosphate-dependent enzyme [Lachnospiraceae bacterium]|nr:aminotransferase class I/II-fold pyridoxal phosphate-dependent enzyme [Lachnospiraceae bacterium]